MKLPVWQIDAFADRVFEGNPAAVCPLGAWLPDDVMQAIAMEQNLSETAFFVRSGDRYQLRWFSPVKEVDLCGHATLASAYVIFNVLGHGHNKIRFATRSGELAVQRHEDWLELDFPSQPPEICEPPPALLAAFEVAPVQCLRREDYIVVFEREADVLAAVPDLARLSLLDLRGVAITARSTDHDFVVRFFAPKYGINEDPVTGSAYTQLVPYWSSVLGRTRLNARQVSRRGGEVRCTMLGDRMRIAGRAVPYMAGTIQIELRTDL